MNERRSKELVPSRHSAPDGVPSTPTPQTPVESSSQQYGQHLQAIFTDGMQVAQALHKENEQLWRQLQIARQQSAQPTPTTDDELKRLRAEAEALRGERDSLRKEIETLHSGMESVQEENQEFAERYISMERQNSNFISLYVASTQLHSTLRQDDVLRNISEIVINLIGGERFAVYLYDPDKHELRCAISEGLTEAEQQPIRDGHHQLFDVARTGALYLADKEAQMDETQPVAIQPLIVSDELVGVLVVHQLLLQKDGFQPIDLELFDLLAGHAATAIMSSQLHQRTQQKAATLEGLLSLLKDSEPTGAGAKG